MAGWQRSYAAVLLNSTAPDVIPVAFCPRPQAGQFAIIDQSIDDPCAEIDFFQMDLTRGNSLPST